MKKFAPYIGIYLIILGVLALVLTRLTALAHSNALLLMGLALVVAGIGLHLRSIKHQSLY